MRRNSRTPTMKLQHRETPTSGDSDIDDALAPYVLDEEMLENYNVAKKMQGHSTFINSKAYNPAEYFRGHSSPENPLVTQSPNPSYSNYESPSDVGRYGNDPNTPVPGYMNAYGTSPNSGSSTSTILYDIGNSAQHASSSIHPNPYDHISSFSTALYETGNSPRHASSSTCDHQHPASSEFRGHTGTLPKDALLLQSFTYDKSKVKTVYSKRF